MQDRFKFRIWYEPEKEMILFNNPTLIDGKVLEGGLLFKNYDHNIKNVHECKPEDFKLMQSTGLKDKNGKLIYEGDIVKLNNKVTAIIEFYRGIFGCRFDKEKKDFTRFLGVGAYSDFEIEVIGNIYKNPELLTEEMQA